MLDYSEEKQKMLLRSMVEDLLALVVIDSSTDEYEVIYTDGGYKEFASRHGGPDFFGIWNTTGVLLMAEEDRERMRRAFEKKHLMEKLKEEDSYEEVCRFYVDGAPTCCRVRVRRDNEQPDTLVLCIRNIDREVRHAKQQEEEREQIAELQDTLQKMRMKRIVSQAHPHFLYNALSSIREIVLEDPEYGADLLYDFTTFLRAGIRAMVSDEKIPFARELENIRAYVNIEKMRFGSRLTVEYEIGTEDFEIIPFGVQSIVENAIRHGIYEKDAPDGRVLIRTEKCSDYVEIRVEDNGTGFDPDRMFREIRDKKRDSTGLVNLIQRLETLMHSSVRIESRIGCGTKVTICIPDASKP